MTWALPLTMAKLMAHRTITDAQVPADEVGSLPIVPELPELECDEVTTEIELDDDSSKG